MRWDTGAAHDGVVPDQHQPAALLRPGAAVLPVADGRHRRPAGGHADDGPGAGGGDAARTVRRPQEMAPTPAHGRARPCRARTPDRDVGNYWADVTRATLRFMLPLCLLWSVLLTCAGRAVDAGGRSDSDAGRCQRRDEGTEDPARPGGADGRGQAARHQRRRLVRPEQRGAAGEPDAVLQLARNAGDHPDPGRGRPSWSAPFTGRRRLTALVFGTHAADVGGLDRALRCGPKRIPPPPPMPR